MQRECGECSACCVTLRIEDKQLQKHADTPCVHLRNCGGCGIYAERPEVCRAWQCGWKLMEGLGDQWRPDLSGILIRLNEDSGLTLQPLRDPAVILTAESVLTLVAGFVSRSVPVFISVPTRLGFCYSLVHLNQPLTRAIQSRDIDLARSIMIQAVARGSEAKTDPVAPLSS